MTATPDTRRWFLASYLSALPEFSDRHPEELLPTADGILAVLAELELAEVEAEP